MSRIRALLPWLIPLLVLGAVAVVSYGIAPWRSDHEFTAEFTSARGLYVGDDVRVMGVDVGRVTGLEPHGDRVLVTFEIDADRPVPAEVRAAVMAPTLVSARFVQLAPAYTEGPRLPPGSTIPIERTAVPVEWDEVTRQLAELTAELGPAPDDPQGPLGEVLDVAASNVEGRGTDLRTTAEELSAALRTVSDGRGDLFAVVRNLQVFVDALSNSHEQIVSFNNRMSSVTQILDANRDDMGAALGSLDTALDDVGRFVRDNRERIGGTVDRTSELAETLAAQRDGVAQVLHVAPTALSNLQGIYQPAHNTVVSALSLTNFANPVQFICSALAAAEDVDAHTGSELCVQQLGPILHLLAVDYPPIMINPTRGVGALPGQLVYTEPGPAPVSSGSELEDLLLPGGR
ncbi:MCE family protein [Rhodococcus zopfii]|uniref:MCE family protein n=1 Tax=Rhodococcus zopfii TaxID=43772 RepID=UPI0011112D0C|nr:MCE family protein [Rhodococcus zopfii]